MYREPGELSLPLFEWHQALASEPMLISVCPRVPEEWPPIEQNYATFRFQPGLEERAVFQIYITKKINIYC